MELYHLYNRGVEKRDIFLDERDYVRFVHNLYEFNTKKNVANSNYRFKKKLHHWNEIDREPIVSVHGWCLMKNHYHLLLSEKSEGGITKFIRRLNVGYANYFNERYTRSGTLFQGRTKKKLIDRESYFLYILKYIHYNPLDYNKQFKNWRRNKIINDEKMDRYLKSYKWSSYRDYSGIKNFPSILDTSLMADLFALDKKIDLHTETITSYTLE